jgi:predicted transcriptional regulator
MPASDISNRWIELFHAGNYGQQGSYTEHDLDRVVSNYDPSFHEAPIVIGTPKDSLPAWAWVAALKREGTALLGKLKQVQPDFARMLAAGQFPKHSIGFYLTPNGPSLRHVGFLGAKPPDLEGLPGAAFSDASRKTIEIEFEGPFADREAILMERQQNPRHFAVDNNSAQLSELAKRRQRERGITFSEALSRVVNEFPELTRPGAVTVLEFTDATGNRYLTSFSEPIQSRSSVHERSTKLHELAKDRASKRNISYGEALGQVSKENPELVGAATESSIDDTRRRIVHSHLAGAELNRLAKARQSDRGISYTDALNQIKQEHPELAE